MEKMDVPAETLPVRGPTAFVALPGVEKAEVSHVSGTAVLTLSAPVEDALLKKTVEDQGYQVI